MPSSFSVKPERMASNCWSVMSMRPLNRTSAGLTGTNSVSMPIERSGRWQCSRDVTTFECSRR